MLHIVMFLSEPCSVFLRTFLPHFLAVMKKDLLKIKKHSSDLFLKRNQTNPKDVKLHNDVEVSLSFLPMAPSSKEDVFWWAWLYCPGNLVSGEQCVPLWKPGPGVIRGSRLLLILGLLWGLLSEFCGFPPPTKTNISKFQFDLPKKTT